MNFSSASRSGTIDKGIGFIGVVQVRQEARRLVPYAGARQ